MAKKEGVMTLIERREQYPFGVPTPTIELKDRSCILRIVNGEIRPNQLSRMKALGYTFVRPDDIADPDSVADFQLIDGRLVRGEHGREVLMKIPRRAYEAAQQAKSKANARLLQQPAKPALVDRVAREFGDHAADFADRSGLVVRDSVERVTLEDE